jgi:hypothetical protein
VPTEKPAGHVQGSPKAGERPNWLDDEIVASVPFWSLERTRDSTILPESGAISPTKRCFRGNGRHMI